MIILLTILYIILFCFLVASLSINAVKKHHLLAKTLTSLGFLLIAIYCGYISDNYNFFISMLWGLIFCFIGDVVLAIKLGERKYILAGIIVFLTGHILLISALGKFIPFTLYELIIPIIFLIFIYFLTAMRHMNTGKIRPYIIIYGFFIALLVSKALMIFITNPASTRNIFLLIGSILFIASDLVLLFVYFYENSWKYLGFINLLLYYTGMYLLACSIMY